MKKALCFFLAILFICCVYVHGKNERFSIEEMITNLTNFQDIPSVQDIVDCWTVSYKIYDAGDMPEWIRWCTLENTDSSTIFVDRGYFPLAYEIDGSLTKRYDYSWEIVYNADGTWNKNLRDEYGAYPVITKHGTKVLYDDYQGDNETLRFFSRIKVFFVRLWDTFKIVAKMLAGVFGNLQYLLPWNNTVPKG